MSWASLATAAGSWALSIFTTACLVAVGWFGHATHWSFGLGDHGGGHHAATAHDAAVATDVAQPVPAASDGTVQFRSQEALERTGIEVQPVEQRPMVSELVVNGVVAYDERRIAQLSTRVPGSIWRVEKRLGDHVNRGDVLLVIDSQDVGQLKAEFLNALVVHESRREQLAILEEVKSAVMGRQLREARACALLAWERSVEQGQLALVQLLAESAAESAAYASASSEDSERLRLSAATSPCL
jgi:multidrug efflux pump subunit AcrA (membrane-fusion protein)